MHDLHNPPQHSYKLVKAPFGAAQQALLSPAEPTGDWHAPRRPAMVSVSNPTAPKRRRINVAAAFLYLTPKTTP